MVIQVHVDGNTDKLTVNGEVIPVCLPAFINVGDTVKDFLYI